MAIVFSAHLKRMDISENESDCLHKIKARSEVDLNE